MSATTSMCTSEKEARKEVTHWRGGGGSRGTYRSSTTSRFPWFISSSTQRRTTSLLASDISASCRRHVPSWTSPDSVVSAQIQRLRNGASGLERSLYPARACPRAAGFRPFPRRQARSLGRPAGWCTFGRSTRAAGQPRIRQRAPGSAAGRPVGGLRGGQPNPPRRNAVEMLAESPVVHGGELHVGDPVVAVRGEPPRVLEARPPLPVQLDLHVSRWVVAALIEQTHRLAHNSSPSETPHGGRGARERRLRRCAHVALPLGSSLGGPRA